MVDPYESQASTIILVANDRRCVRFSMSSHANVLREHELIQCLACSYTKHSAFTLELRRALFCYRHYWWALWTDIKQLNAIGLKRDVSSFASTNLSRIRWTFYHLQSKLIRVRKHAYSESSDLLAMNECCWCTLSLVVLIRCIYLLVS